MSEALARRSRELAKVNALDPPRSRRADRSAFRGRVGAHPISYPGCGGIEKATVRRVSKPWGRASLSPWLRDGTDNERIGEAWFERTAAGAPPTKLLLKLLFTSEPLSVQVHPDDDRARAMGLDNGKTEAWYVLAADAGSRARRQGAVQASELRDGVVGGTLDQLLDWQQPRQPAMRSSSPAGTIHAIGGGFVLAEIQQRSDATYRLF